MPCEITLYHCPEDGALIHSLGQAANRQQARNQGFSDVIQPWKDLCSNEFHFVARDTTGVVCGWLTAKWKTDMGERKGKGKGKGKSKGTSKGTSKGNEEGNFMYLVEISTRRIRNALYGGVGQRLHQALVAHARSLGANFIALYPLNPEVKALYMKPEWGYVELRPDVNQLFHILKKAPSDEYLDSVAVPDPIAQANDIAGNDAALLRTIERLAPSMRSNPACLRQLAEDIEVMEGNELPRTEQKKLLRQFFRNWEPIL